mmetsp:Transcript_19517/g.28917  ORF Transcript_19517/g.28917 Transcript_19517/m.28917 type:complete len:382 (-) Transcript_19517:227-1372(-)
MKKYNQSASSSRTASIIALCLLLLSVQLSYAKLSIIPQKAPSSLNLQTVPRGGGWAKAKVATVASSPSKSTAKQNSSSAITEGLKNTLASGLAAACSKTILAPFDTLKTVQQHVSGGKSLGLLEATRQVVSRPGGILNLYAGLGVAALGSMPSVGLYFGVYSYCKKTIGETLQTTFGSMRGDTEHPAVCSDRTLQTLTIIASAAIGNTVASFSRVPYEVVKQSLQTGQYSSTLQAASTMWRDGGMRSFFPLGGVSIQMVRDIPYAIFTLLSYEFIKENWVLKRTEEDPSKRWFFDMVAGATAGGIGSYLTNPMDVIKTRLQTTGGSSKYGGSIVKCAAVVLEEGGPTAFLRGSVPRLMHKIPANGCFFVFYEFFRRALRVE